MLKEFHEKYGHHINSMPTAYTSSFVRELRLKLMYEELRETETALGQANLEKLLDGLADLLYVVFGTAVSYGLAPLLEEVFTEVHRSNMTKGGPTNEYGKTLKGDSWEPPKIKEIIKRHMDKYHHMSEYFPIEPRTAKGSLD